VKLVERAEAHGICGGSEYRSPNFCGLCARKIKQVIAIAIDDRVALTPIKQDTSVPSMPDHLVCAVAFPANLSPPWVVELQVHSVVHFPITKVEPALASTFMNQRAISNSCKALLQISPVPYSQNQCQL
jgi:hypothetical protein